MLECQGEVSALSGKGDVKLSQSAISCGVDMVEIKRIALVIDRRPSFVKKIFTENEQLFCKKSLKPEQLYAVCFAAKEAVVKALGYGFTAGIQAVDIEIRQEPKVRPRVVLSGKAAILANETGIAELLLSLSHTHFHAIAWALALGKDDQVAALQSKNTQEHLQMDFKDLRTILDQE